MHSTDPMAHVLGGASERDPLRTPYGGTSADLLDATREVGAIVDSLREARRMLNGAPVEVTDALHAAVCQIQTAQRALTYELGLALRVEEAR